MLVSELQNRIIDVIKEDAKKQKNCQTSEDVDYKKIQSQTEHKGENVDVYV